MEIIAKAIFIVFCMDMIHYYCKCKKRNAKDYNAKWRLSTKDDIIFSGAGRHDDH
jgi:hypothetical protein